MSCFVMRKESIRDIADFVNSIIERGRNAYGIEAPEELIREFKTGSPIQNEQIYVKLYLLNIEAVKTCYPNASETVIPKRPEGDFRVGRVNVTPGRNMPPYYMATAKHYEILKKITCFLYQCDEGDVPKTQIYKGMKKLEYNLMNMIIYSHKAYQDADWG